MSLRPNLLLWWRDAERRATMFAASPRYPLSDSMLWPVGDASSMALGGEEK